jgi:hypothetical protein
MWVEVTMHHLHISVQEVEGLCQLQHPILDLDGVEMVLLRGYQGNTQHCTLH